MVQQVQGEGLAVTLLLMAGAFLLGLVAGVVLSAIYVIGRQAGGW